MQEPTDEELCEQYHIEDNWARPALLFAVRSGLMQGRSNGIDQKAGSTRAEVATVLIRMLGIQSRQGLSSFVDVDSSAWYYMDLSRAYGLGIINGTSAHHMSPNAKITREQTFVMLSRVFGVTGKGFQSVLKYSDWASVSDWAREPLAAMIDAGYVSGSNNKLNPKGQITRQELAQVLYNVIQSRGTEIEPEFTGSCVLTADTVPEGTVVHGDLLLSNECDVVRLKNVTVTGKLIVQGKGYLYLSLTDCSIGELVLCRNTDLSVNDTLPCVRAVGALKLSYGRIAELQSWLGTVIVGEGGVVENAVAMKENRYTVEGRVKRLELRSINVSVDGSGKLEKLRIYKKGAQVDLACEDVYTEIDFGPQGVSVTRTDSVRPTMSNPSVTASVKLTNVPAGEKRCIAQWLLEGEPISEPFVLKLTEGAVVTTAVNFQKFIRVDTNKVSAAVQLSLNLDGEKYTHSVRYSTEDALIEAAKAVRTQNVKATTRYSTTLYRNSSLSGYLTSVPYNTDVIYITYSGTSAAYVQLPNGMRGWVPYGSISIWQNTKFYVTWDYSSYIKEYWVNHVKQASSKSNYLIWVSLYTQRVNVFYGSKGNWKLVQTFACATGKNTTPTKVQDTVIQYKTSKWNFDDFYVHSVCNLDANGRAFHSRPKYYGSGNVYDWTMGCPVSHGCIRMMDEGCNYIYNYVPVGTTVVIY